MKTLVAQGFAAFLASRPETPFPAFSRQVCQNFARKFDRSDLRVSESACRAVAPNYIRRARRSPLRVTAAVSGPRSQFGDAPRPDGGSDGR